MAAETLLWVIGASALMLFAGLAGGYLFRGREAREREAQLQAEIGELRDNYDGHKQRVTVHFEKSSDLFRDLTSHYAALYVHLADGAREFCTGMTPPFRAELPLLLAEGEAEAAPVANGATFAKPVNDSVPGPPGSTIPGAVDAPGVVVDAPGMAPSTERGRADSESASESRATAVSGARPNRGRSAKHSKEGIADWLARVDARERQAPGPGRFRSGYVSSEQDWTPGERQASADSRSAATSRRADLLEDPPDAAAEDQVEMVEDDKGRWQSVEGAEVARGAVTSPRPKRGRRHAA